MKIKRARYTYAHERQARKPRRRVLFAGLFSVILLLFGAYGIAYFVKDTAMPSVETVPSQGGTPRTTFATPPPSPTSLPSAETVPSLVVAATPPAPPAPPTSLPSAETVPSPATLAKDVQLAWPAVGQAAV